MGGITIGGPGSSNSGDSQVPVNKKNKEKPGNVGNISGQKAEETAPANAAKIKAVAISSFDTAMQAKVNPQIVAGVIASKKLKKEISDAIVNIAHLENPLKVVSELVAKYAILAAKAEGVRAQEGQVDPKTSQLLNQLGISQAPYPDVLQLLFALAHRSQTSIAQVCVFSQDTKPGLVFADPAIRNGEWLLRKIDNGYEIHIKGRALPVTIPENGFNTLFGKIQELGCRMDQFIKPPQIAPGEDLLEFGPS